MRGQVIRKMIKSQRFFLEHSARYSGKAWSSGADGKNHKLEVLGAWWRFMVLCWKDARMGLLIVIPMLSGCQLFTPIPTAVQQGGSDVMLSCRTWHENGNLESELIIGREGLSQYPQGVDVKIEQPSSCVGLTLGIPEVVQGDASLTRLTLEQRAAAMAEFISLIRALAPELPDG